MAQPPFLLTYFNPFSDDPKKNSLVGSYLDYVKDTSLAKYNADVVGSYLEETSSSQLEATESIGRAVCGEFYDGFSKLQAQLKRADLQQSRQLGQISSRLQQVVGVLDGVNQRLELVRDEVKTSNVLLENISELLRIPDSQKQRQHHIEMALKFLKNARKDQDLYQDALQDLLDAEKLKRDDFFVLHRIGMIYLYAPDLIDLEKALDYFTRAAKYAAVESDPDSVRLSNVLNKQVNKKFADQADRLPDKESDEAAESFEDSISALAAESYFQAGAALYALGRFDEAVKMAGKAVARKNNEAKYLFFCSKYQARSGKHEEAVKQLVEAIEIAPEMAMAAVGDYDLNRSQSVLDVLTNLNAKIVAKLEGAIKDFKDWPTDDWNKERYNKAQEWVTSAEKALGIGNYAERIELWGKEWSKFSHYWPFGSWPSIESQWSGYSLSLQLNVIKKEIPHVNSYGVKYDKETALLVCLNPHYEIVHGEWKLRRSQIASITNETISSISQKPENCDDEEIGLNFKDLVLLTTADKDYFTFGGVVKWKRDGGIIMFAVDSKEAVFIIGCDTRIVREWQQVDGTRRVERKSDYYIIAIDSKSGKDIWRRPLLLDGGCPVSMCIGGSGEWIFINHKGKVGSNNQGCCAINPLTGYTIWSVKIDGGKICDPCHLVYCASNNAIYFCMAIANGSNEVYETYVDIVILNASNGSITNRYSELVRHEQRVELHEQPKASRQALDDRPHIVLSKNNTIYLDSVYGVLMAFDLNRKKVIWKRTGDICLLAIGDNETLLLQDGNKYLFAINGFNGDVLWRINTKIEARHGISANKIFYTNSGAFHENDGTHLFEFNEEVYTNSAPCVGDNHTCYYISTDGLVVAIDGLTGKEIWKTCPLDIKIPNQLGHPCVIGASGTLYYYIASPHCLLSVASTSKGPANSPWPMVGQNCQHTCSPLSAKPT